MTDIKFIELCKNEVVKYTNDHLDKTDGKQISSDDVYIVWLTKVLQNNKALLSTTLFDGMYYELTYNGDKNELYIDACNKLMISSNISCWSVFLSVNSDITIISV